LQWATRYSFWHWRSPSGWSRALAGSSRNPNQNKP